MYFNEYDFFITFTPWLAIDNKYMLKQPMQIGGGNNMIFRKIVNPKTGRCIKIPKK